MTHKSREGLFPKWGWYSHVKQHIVLGTDTQILPNGAHLRADVLPQDVGRARGGREESSQDGPEKQRVQESELTTSHLWMLPTQAEDGGHQLPAHSSYPMDPKRPQQTPQHKQVLHVKE